MRLLSLLSTLLLSVHSATFAPPKGSGVVVTVENGSKGMNIGSGDQVRFDLNEQYFPLSRAGKATGDLDALRVRLAGVKNVVRDRAPNSIVPEEEEHDETTTASQDFPMPRKLVDGEWQEWTSWSSCSEGKRTRIRTCVASRPAWRVTCVGDAKETAECFDTVKKTAIASDPWTIEREITGGNIKEE